MLEILKVIILIITHLVFGVAGFFFAILGVVIKEDKAIKNGCVEWRGKVYEIKEKRAEA